jgi:hypothetical protein
MDSISKLTDQDNLPDSIVDFTDGVAATKHLMERAIQSGSFIEYVCLAASMVDAILRNGIMLQKKLNNPLGFLEGKLLSQKDKDNPITEREIYRISCSLGIIDQDMHKRLNILYTKRNKCIHRFIISKITYEFVRDVAAQYAGIIVALRDILEKIELEHIRLSTGDLNEDPEVSEEDLVDTYHEMLTRKIDNSNIYHSSI